MSNVRVRFAPSPTGALHIGGLRTALYNYLFAKKMGGTFILRIEDTDQTRYVDGAEQYVLDALNWCGIQPEEGPGMGGEYGPYRQSERKAMYGDYARQLVAEGKAYYAFDTPEELDAQREAEKEKGNHTFRYDNQTRGSLRNSTAMTQTEVEHLLANNADYVIRLLIQPNQEVKVHDIVRGEVTFSTNELDDKVLLKGDGMPTYHLANIVDDHLMKISHVIRGEEWLPSTAHHVLLYQAFGWEATMPQFAHLPLILKPTGKGKLSKRDGQKLGIPVFPLSWVGETAEESFFGFREFGFLPDAALNFLAFLGWNPGTEQEIFNLEELVEAFNLEQIGKSGARFDFDKAKWYNEQYIEKMSAKELSSALRPFLPVEYLAHSKLERIIEEMRGRFTTLAQFPDAAHDFFYAPASYDEKQVAKRFKPELKEAFEGYLRSLAGLNPFNEQTTHDATNTYMETNDLKPGQLLPLLRLGLAGNMKGPGVFAMMEILGREESLERLRKVVGFFG